MNLASQVLLKGREVSPICPWIDKRFNDAGIEVFIKQDYLNHPIIQGNKLWKLLEPLDQFLQSEQERIISFGGAYSNHLLALSHATELMEIPFIAVIRGERPPTPGHTLRKIMDNSFTKLVYLSRGKFSDIVRNGQYEGIPEEYKDAMIIPEGGSRKGALKGLKILSQEIEKQMSNQVPDQVWLAAGTGGTSAGLVQYLSPSIQVVSVPVLKHDHMRAEIAGFLPQKSQQLLNRLLLVEDAHWGGYAKVHQAGIKFMNAFYQKISVPLDPIYNAKVFYAFYRAVEKGEVKPGQRVLLLHTGGLQGLLGFKERHGKHVLNYS